MPVAPAGGGIPFGSRQLGKTVAVAFGQPSGPPASASQVRELLGLLNDAGHATFRVARGPMGFTQRQGAGKFTRQEASELITRMQDAGPDQAVAPPVPASRLTSTPPTLRRIPAEDLAAELQRRGWTVTPP